MSIYQHFRKHEHPFVDQVLSWVDQVGRSYTFYITDFLDPREQQIVASLIGTNHDEVRFNFFGGHQETERKRACISPYYEEITESYFQIDLLEATYPSKFVAIEHRDILGAFMSLGIERKMLGDIIVSDGIFQLFLANELTDYVRMNLTQVKQATVSLMKKPYNTLIASDEVWKEGKQTVSSLRLDVMMKEIYRISRSDAAQLIKHQRVKVNFKEVDDVAFLLMKDDLISVRGYGRSKVVEIGGTTRKNKLSITTARLKE